MSRVKRVFLITIDCLRADHVGCIGGKSLTPNIDKLAQDSVVFTRAFANGPGTNQSFPAILTSTYFLMHGGMRLLPHCTTLAEALSKHGFETVAFHSNPFLSRNLGWSKGFNEFYDFIDIIKSPSAAVTRSSLQAKAVKFIDKLIMMLNNRRIQSILRRFYYRLSEFQIPYIEGSELNKHVIKWITENKKKRFFLWMHYMDPHRPYVPPPPNLQYFSTRKEAFLFDVFMDSKIGQANISKEELDKLRGLYEGEVRYVDNCIGMLIGFLKNEGLLEDSLLILNADHGEAFLEHNRLTHAFDIAYNEVIHVPLIIYGLTDHSKVSDDYVQLLDVPPTILDATGIGKPDDFIGDSLVSTRERHKNSGFIFSESAKPDLINLRYDTSKIVVSCIADEWKLIINELWRTTELYNLKEDFYEEKNLATIERKICKELTSLIQEHLSAVSYDRLKTKSRTAEEKQIKKRLRALGYID